MSLDGIMRGTNPLAVTLEHLSPKDGKPRKSVAAHMLCNTHRNHAERPPAKTIDMVKSLLSNRVGML